MVHRLSGHFGTIATSLFTFVSDGGFDFVDEFTRPSFVLDKVADLVIRQESLGGGRRSCGSGARCVRVETRLGLVDEREGAAVSSHAHDEFFLGASAIEPQVDGVVDAQFLIATRLDEKRGIELSIPVFDLYCWHSCIRSSN